MKPSCEIEGLLSHLGPGRAQPFLHKLSGRVRRVGIGIGGGRPLGICPRNDRAQHHMNGNAPGMCRPEHLQKTSVVEYGWMYRAQNGIEVR